MIEFLGDKTLIVINCPGNKRYLLRYYEGRKEDKETVVVVVVFVGEVFILSIRGYGQPRKDDWS